MDHHTSYSLVCTYYVVSTMYIVVASVLVGIFALASGRVGG